MENKSVIEKAEVLGEQVCTELGLFLWDVEFKKEGGNHVLRYFIDKESGVDITDCENVSRMLDEPLDEMDFIPVSYCLEVSSPGLDRPLKKEEHFLKYIGEVVDVKTFAKINNSKNNTGTLLAYNNGDITLLQDEGEIVIEKKNIVNVKVHIEF